MYKYYVCVCNIYRGSEVRYMHYILKPANEKVLKYITRTAKGDVFSKLPNWQVYIMHIDQ